MCPHNIFKIFLKNKQNNETSEFFKSLYNLPAASVAAITRYGLKAPPGILFSMYVAFSVWFFILSVVTRLSTPQSLTCGIQIVCNRL